LGASWPALSKAHGKYLNFNFDMNLEEGYISKRWVRFQFLHVYVCNSQFYSSRHALYNICQISM
jgi:hypothetical protein